MKKLTLIIAVLLVIQSINSQDWIEFSPSETTSPSYNLLSSTDTIVEFEVLIPGMHATEVDSFQRVNIPQHVKLDSAGCPEIPVVSFLVAIPECDSIALNTTVISSEKINDMFIYPAPEWVNDTTPEGYSYLREEFSYNDTVYSTNEFFNGTISELTGRGAVRDQQVIRVLLYPVQFNPVTKEVITYSELKISLSFVNPAGSVHQDVGIFNEMLGNSLVNYESNGLNASVSCGMEATTLNCEDYFVTSLPNQKVDDPCDYLIIAPAEFFENTWLCDLADHRTSYNGFDVKIVTTDVIEDDMPQQLELNWKIQLLISNTYFSENANNTYDGKLAYVNLVGDVMMESTLEGIPTFYDPYDPTLGGYDVQYTQLTIPPNQNTPDIYPDLMIGRCSVDNETQLQNVVTKITGFTPYLYPYNDKILNFLGTESSGYYIHQSEVIEKLEVIFGNSYDNELIYPEDYNGYLPGNWYSQSYTTDPIPIVTASYSTGQVFFNYMGHGTPTTFDDLSYANIYSTPVGIFPFFISGACKTGIFQSIEDEECLGEKFLCDEPDRGAIGFIGASVTVSGSSFHIISNYYESTLNNYSLMLGEAFMETKFQYCENYYHYINSYNLLGDPALNIFYENAAPLPDLSIKDKHISFSPFPTNLGETIIINAHIRNNTGIPVDHPFTVNCYAENTDSQEIIQIDDKIVQSVPDNYVDVPFYWNTTGFALNENDFYVYIEIDIYEEITEIIETNNSNSNNLKLYLYAPDFPVEVEKADNANPVCFDFYSEYDGDEIVFGENIFSLNGNEILASESGTNGNTSVGNLYNNDKFQYLTIKTDQVPIEIEAFEPPSANSVWQYQISQNSTDWVGPVISDLDHDGFEEVITLEILPDGTKLICLDHDGDIRWNYEFTNEINEYFLVCNLNNPFNHIVIIDTQGTIYFYKENENNNGMELDNTFELPNCGYLDKKFIASDLDKNGYIDFVVIYKVNSVPPVTTLGILNTLDMSFTDVEVINSGNFGDPIATDLNNDGLLEIAIQNFGSENIYIYDNNLSPPNIITIDDLALSEIVSGDFNNDGSNDLVVLTQKNETDYFLNIYDHSGNQILQTPIIDKLASVLISDINHDNDNEIIYSYGRNLYVVDIPDAGQGIGWPGHRGNIRCTGVLEQPAYIPGVGETVYWTNTISLSGDNIITQGSTVIIKPCTKIRAYAESSLVVGGTLIAEGSENHPILFTADINGADNDYWQGITLTNGSSSSLKHVHISNAEFGVLYEDFAGQTLENCEFTNNVTGVGAFNSSPEIYKCLFTGHSRAIGSYSNGSPILTDLYGAEEYNNAIIDNFMGIYVASGSLYLDEGYNDIYNDPATGYYIFSTNHNRIRASFNYWGSTNIEEIKNHLFLSDFIFIKPVCTGPNTSYKSGNPVKELLKEAYSSLKSGNYEDAEIKFKQIIIEYPLENEAYLSVPGLHSCYSSIGNNWGNLEIYLSELYADTLNVSDKKLLFGYLNLCKRAQGKYTEAIVNYESIILNNPTYNDSVYAVIDIGNTYEEAGNYKSTLGQLSYLVPDSRAKHVEKTVDLLLSLRTEEIKSVIDKSDFVLGQNYPNPFDNTTTINYYLPNRCKISFEILDILGKEVININQGSKQKGEHKVTLDLSNFSTGVYYYILKADNSVAGVRKMVVK